MRLILDFFRMSRGAEPPPPGLALSVASPLTVDEEINQLKRRIQELELYSKDVKSAGQGKRDPAERSSDPSASAASSSSASASSSTASAKSAEAKPMQPVLVPIYPFIDLYLYLSSILSPDSATVTGLLLSRT